MPVSIEPKSRLRFAELVSVDGYEFFDIIDYPTIVAQPDDISYQVQDSDRLDLLAQDYYGNSVLFWVIALANDIELVSADLTKGEIITIPSPRYVTQELFATAKTA